MITTSPLPTPDTPRRTGLNRSVAMQLARTEYQRTAEALASLEPDDWSRRTACPAWNVRQLACHMVGMATMASTPWESSRQQKLATAEARTHGGAVIDSLTALQVRERENLTPDEVVEAARRIAPRAARGRRLTPGLIRRRALPDAQVVNGEKEMWTIGYLIDVVLTRDPWMHRIDMSRATGRQLLVTADHDGVIVDDVVREWAERHGGPYRLELTGPAGGHWASVEQPADTVEISMDAVEFCLILSGRGTGDGLLTTQVPF
ncbi:MAG: maleylpyruvate isomerase family mycothiol-dependent enzyme [Aeromicrobium sp.]